MPDNRCEGAPRKSTRELLLVLSALLSMTAPTICQGQEAATPGHPVVAGFERFYAHGDSDPVKGGQLLLGELNCVSCHAIDTVREAVVLRKSAPILDGVGSRVKTSYLRKFIADPQATKPGTAMPNVLAAMPEQQRAESVEALVHFLASTGTIRGEKPQKKLIATGQDLYAKVGCVVCHGTRDAAGKQAKLFATSLPLGDLAAKYSLTSLRAFLEQPHVTRPSGRMPVLLDGKEATAVANYLLQGIAFELSGVANLNYAYYEGEWDNLPDFTKLKPKATGMSVGFDLDLAARVANMAMKFDGFLKIDRDGDYRFDVTSDDGSKLWIDGKLVVSNDGIHAPAAKTGSMKLAKGPHAFTVAVFNGGGGVELNVEMEGPGIGRQPATAFLFRTAEGNPGAKPLVKHKTDAPLAVDPALAAKGRALFTSVGCASCHTLNLGKKVVSTLKAPALAKLEATGGCLSPTAKEGVPHYLLSTAQRAALAAAIKNPPASDKLTPNETIARTMATFNCYACHERNKVGGVLPEVNPSFTSAQPEMGDEGRLPPSLTGAGAKLNGEFLRHILDKGAHDRPYMFTRMPGFGNPNVGVLVAMLENADPAESAPSVTFDIPLTKVKTEARALVGAGALACIKCHTFAKNKAEGVQGLDMTLMTQRLRKSWFHNYLENPNKYRPGTRMPAAWPDGQTLLPKYLGGSTDRQIEGVWVYLKDGAKASLPPGMKKLAIPLVPTKDAIIYRNFIEGAGPRAIAVGYPEQAHLAFDANNLRLAMIWQGAFMDASRHWTDRGSGYEPPAGDNVQHLPEGVAFAVLTKPDEAWPKKTGRELPEYRFNGYRVTHDGRPTFLYTVHGVKVEDFPTAVTSSTSPSIRRTLTLSASAPVENLFFRAATAGKITPLGDEWFQVNDVKMRIEGGTPFVRQSSGQFELLVPVNIRDGHARVLQEFQW